MFRFRPFPASAGLVLALALGAAAPVAVWPVGVAAAAEAASEAPGVVAIVPVPWAVADGSSAVQVRVVVLSADGRPMSGVTLRPSSTAGEASGWTEVGPGLYRFDLTPPDSDKAVEATVKVEGKVGKAPVEAETVVRFARKPGAELRGTTTPETVVLGQNKEATLSIEGGPPKGELLVRHTTSAEIVDMTNMGGGKFTARLVAPKENFPQLGIVAVANAANPVHEYGYVVVPFHGAVNYPVQAPPGSSVLLEVAGKEFGPVKAGDDGKAAVPIVVPPGVNTATQIAVLDGERTESTLDLRVPETPRIKAVPTARSVPADSSVKLPIRVVVLDPGGKPDPKAEVAGRTTSGALGAFRHIGRGVYEATFTPADADQPGEAKITVGIEGNDKQTDTLSFALTPRRATELLVTTDPAQLAPDTETIRLVAVANGSDGKPVTGQTLHLDVTGGKAGEVQEQGEGRYAASIEREADVVQIGALVTGQPSNNPATHVVVLPARSFLQADGAAAMRVVVVATDAFGTPVPGVEVALSATGGASLPDAVTTNEHGFAAVELTSGKAPALVEIAAKAGPARGAAAVIQGGKRKALKDLPVGVSASKDVRRLVRSWAGASANLRLAVDPDAPLPRPALSLAEPGAETARLDVVFFPAEVAPGGQVTVRAIPYDDQDRAIPGKTLDVLTSAGKLGKTQEDGGIYETVLTVDPDAEAGEAKVSVVAPSGVMKLVRIPINPDAAPAADQGDAVAAADGAPEQPEEPPEEAAPDKPPREPRQPAAPGDHPWLRARVSGAGTVYRYAQTPSDEPGPLLPAPLTVGGEGAAPATPMGFELNGRGWHPDIPYVGGVANVRASWYAIASGAFEGNAPDWLYDVRLMAAGRYPFDVGADRFWVGGVAGFTYGDFMLFTGCIDPGCQVNFDPLGMPGLGLGAEVGAEIDASNLYFVGGYTHSLANFTVPYAHAIDANIGMMVVEPVDVDLGFSWVNRRVALQGTESGSYRGEIADNQLVFKLGVGFEM